MILSEYSNTKGVLHFTTTYGVYILQVQLNKILGGFLCFQHRTEIF